MRELFFLVLGVVSLGGCSMTVAESIPRAHQAKSYVVHFVASEKPHSLLGNASGFSLNMDTAGDGLVARASRAPARLANLGTVGAAMTQVLEFPPLLNTLRQDMTVALVIVGSLAALNIALIARVFIRRRPLALGLASNEVTTIADSAKIEIAFQKSAIENDEPGPRCSCDAPISSRSRTGRCRRCARNARNPRTRISQSEIHNPLKLTIGATDESDTEGLETCAVLMASRLGKRGEYYSVVS